MKERIKLIYIVNASMPNERANGVQIAHTCEALGKEGIDLTLYTRWPQRIRVPLETFFGIKKTFAHRLLFSLDIPYLPFRYAIRNGTFFISANIYLVYAYCLSKLGGYQLVVYVRGELVLPLIPLSNFIPVFFETHQIRNYERLYQSALRHAKGIVVITDRLKHFFVEEYHLSPQKIAVARDAVDVNAFTPRPKDNSLWEQHGIPTSRRIVLYSGTLSAEKGVHTLAAAATHVQPDVQIVFLGGTEEQIASFRKQYGAQKNISILGRVSHTEVPIYIAAADILVLPDSKDYAFSNLYTSPMKLFEYMASERPILASRVPSLLEVLDEHTATFFESEDAAALADGIQTILTNTEHAERTAHNARKKVLQFTWEKRADVIWRHIVCCMDNGTKTG